MSINRTICFKSELFVEMQKLVEAGEAPNINKLVNNMVGKYLMANNFVSKYRKENNSGRK